MVIIESIVVAAIGWVASPLVGKLLNEGFKSLGINADKKLQELRVTVLPLLKSVIEKAEGSAHQSEVEDWLQRLKDAYDDAEDALDLLNYHRLEREAANGVRSPFLIMPVLNGGRNMLSPQKIKIKLKLKLKHMLNELEKTASEALKLRDLIGAQSDHTAAVPGTPEIAQPPPRVFGRVKDRAKIIYHLKMDDPRSTDIPVIAIVGRPGVGKTTLAQYVYDKLEGEGCDRHFDLIMWVHASRNFKALEIMKEIIQLSSIESESQDVGNLSSTEPLRQKMIKKLKKKKKFLLVIDDVWCDEEDHTKNWDTLFGCLSKCCSPGSKILVTAQTYNAPGKIVAGRGATLKYTHDLQELEENHFWKLFIHHALPGKEMNSYLKKDLEKEGKRIAKKLNKDPSAAKMVGQCLQQEKEVRYWRDAEQKNWSDDKTKALMWSYRHLPAHLQRCFSYCSLYPRGYKFQALELVQLWMAQGFIKPDGRNKRMEDVGSQYLKELVSRFYIQHHKFGYYTLHELLYDLAEKVTRNEFLRFEGNHNGKIPPTIRHLCIPADKLNEKKEEICKLKKLRTLIIVKGKSITLEENVATNIFNSLKKLRVLVLKLHIENFVEFIGEMKHLRVLQVFGTSKFVLPESVCTFYLLQVLKVHNTSSLPKHLNNLVNLRYLQPSDIADGIADIGKLTSLQGLGKFHVRKEKGYELEQLQNLNELRGRLHIDNLENVGSKKSAIAANLKEKKYLDELKLVWHDGEDNVNSSLDVNILKDLQLPPNLTRLSLDGYRRQLWPSWPKSQTSNIRELVLRQCKLLEELPPMDKLYPSCESLELWHLSKLKALYALPPRLQKIKILGSPFLTFASNEDLQMSPDKKGSIIEVMSKSLRKGLRHQNEESLVNDEKEMMNFIAAVNDSNNEATSAEHNKNVPVLKRWLEMHKRKMELIYNRQNEAKLLLPPTLTELNLEGCNITDHALSACLQTLTSLTHILLKKIKTVTCLPSKDVLRKLKALQSLSLFGFWALTSLGGIRSLPHLTYLKLDECPCLDSKTAILPSSLEIITFSSCADVDLILANADLPVLSDLTIRQCHMLENASLQFGNLPSLRYSKIEGCSGLSFLVNVQKLRFLRSLSLRNCSNLQEVKNFPRSLKRLRIQKCPILEKSIKSNAVRA